LPGANRATNAPYTVLDGTTVLATAPLNQEQTPNDFTADGAAWEDLGQFTVTSGTLKVRLSDAANEFVIADAVRIAPVASASQIQAVVAGHGSDGGKLSPGAVRLDANDAGSRFVGPEHATPFIATSAGTHDGMDIGKPSLFERFFARRGAHRP
jgi:hypothetical protein